MNIIQIIVLFLTVPLLYSINIYNYLFTPVIPDVTFAKILNCYIK